MRSTMRRTSARKASSVHARVLTHRIVAPDAEPDLRVKSLCPGQSVSPSVQAVSQLLPFGPLLGLVQRLHRNDAEMLESVGRREFGKRHLNHQQPSVFRERPGANAAPVGANHAAWDVENDVEVEGRLDPHPCLRNTLGQLTNGLFPSPVRLGVPANDAANGQGVNLLVFHDCDCMSAPSFASSALLEPNSQQSQSVRHVDMATEDLRQLNLFGDAAGELLTAEQLADLLQMRRSTIEDYARRGLLPSLKLGRHRRFIRSDVLDALDELRRQAS